MGELFGTDGIRGHANHYPITPEMALRVGKAAATYFGNQKKQGRPIVVIGKDPRLSGAMIESALVSGLCSLGADVFLAGVLPTPGVAYLTSHLKADAGIVVSASHNPFYDNGIKFFNKQGCKLSDEIENEIEKLILEADLDTTDLADNAVGQVRIEAHAGKLYQDFLIQNLPEPTRAKCTQLKIAIDCANGATSMVAPGLFRKLGINVIDLATTPDGININATCGSQHPEELARTVVDAGCHVGFAFDGDGDRLIAVDEKGTILSGDQLIAIFAKDLQELDILSNQTVVTTVMSNMGLGKALNDMQIRHLKSAVGDRYVMQEMVTAEAILGGEDSGHIIFLNQHTTGDGLLAALQVIRILASRQTKMSDLTKVMRIFPQTLLNVDVKSKPPIPDIPGLTEAMTTTEKKLEDQGRILIRYSGTQPLCRVMVEAATEADANNYCAQLADIIRRKIGK
jgi:phosphoglucosamine mutase